MSRLIARRVRSRDQETESTNERVLRRGSVSTSKVPDRAIIERKQWPGGPRVRPGDLTVETVEELDGRFNVGETVTYSTDAALTIGTTAVAVPLDTVDADTLSGRKAGDLPASGTTHRFGTTGYKTVTVGATDCPVGSDGLTIDVKVDGTVRASYTAPYGHRLEPETLRIGKVDAGVDVSVELSSDASHDVDGITVTFEHVDVGAAVQAQSPTEFEVVTPGSAGADLTSSTASVTRQAQDDVQVGDLLLITAQAACTSIGSYGTWTPPSGVTEVHRFPYVGGVGGGGNGVECAVFATEATADDVAGTRDYSASLTGSAIQAVNVTVLVLRGVTLADLGTVTTDQGTSGTDTQSTRTAAAPGGNTTIGVAMGVRNNTTTTSDTDYQQTYTGLTKQAMFASSTYGGSGYTNLDQANRRGGFQSVATADGDVPVEVLFGSEYTHQFVVAIGVS